MGDKSVSIKLTKKELWELINIFQAGFESGAEGNEIPDRVSEKLATAYRSALKQEDAT